MSKTDELREALGNAIYDAQTPDGLQSPSAYQAATPAIAAAIVSTLGITRSDVGIHLARAEYWREHLMAAGEPTWDFPAEEMDSKRKHGQWHAAQAAKLTALLDLAEGKT